MKKQKIKNSSNINYWIGFLLGFIIIGFMIQIGINILAQESDCFHSLAEQYPNVSCGSAGVIYCEWQNNTYKVIGHQEESRYWCSLEGVDSTDELYEGYYPNWLFIIALVIMDTIIISLLLYCFDGKKNGK